MPNRKICFRFDVDTHKCARSGMPNLMALAKVKSVKFTFFVNCGRAISRRESLKAALAPKAVTEGHPMLGARRKLGNWDFLICALINPAIIKYQDIIKQAYADGHEIGLHGGRNHEAWCRRVADWSESHLRSEIEWGVAQLRHLGIEARTFASPCAQGGDRVRQMISTMPQFEFISDDLNPASRTPKMVSTGVPDIPTAICGQGGVAYIEQLVAMDKTRSEIVETFRRDIRQHHHCVFYDHPYFAGCEALPILSDLIDCARQENYEVCSLNEIGRQFQLKGASLNP